ncbi:biopolymer transporter ExbD [bacterium]|nr:biopolymer transporter ExbD [candidate division CSSED10-310 bacterium]
MKFNSANSLKPELNMTPLIDVVLMLLIFFMISTSFVFQPGIMVKLPSSAISADIQSTRMAQVIVTSEGDVYFDRLRVDIDNLEQQMSDYKDKSLLIIKADRSVAHGLVVTIMDCAKKAGFERLTIATSPLIEEPGERN